MNELDELVNWTMKNKRKITSKDIDKLLWDREAREKTMAYLNTGKGIKDFTARLKKAMRSKKKFYLGTVADTKKFSFHCDMGTGKVTKIPKLGREI